MGTCKMRGGPGDKVDAMLDVYCLLLLNRRVYKAVAVLV